MADRLGLNDRELLALGHLFHNGPLQPGALSELLRLSPGATTSLLDRLENAGHVIREQNPLDRRSVVISLTPTGVRAMEWVIARSEAVLSDALTEGAALDDATLAQFTEAANVFGDALAGARTDDAPPLATALRADRRVG